MRRRQFIAFLSGIAVAWSRATRAQAPKKPEIGFLSSGSQQTFAPFAAALLQGLHETGYVEGQNIAIEYRWAEGQYDRLSTMADELVRLPVAVIATSGGTVAAHAAKAATATIPIVFGTADDPVAIGLVASLNRPGGNLTGVAFLSTELAGKRLEFLRQLVPQAESVAVLVNPNSPESETIARDTQEAANTIGAKVLVLEASTEGEIDAAFTTLKRERVGALIVGTDPFFYIRRNQLVALAARNAVPTVYPLREFVTTGGLISYGTSFTEGYREMGAYVGRILKGEKPADLPVIQPTKFEMVINLRTAKELGLAVPPTLLAIADEVIE
jgi:putative tryptophan/tyrosine transport system substrate-binding protein